MPKYIIFKYFNSNKIFKEKYLLLYTLVHTSINEINNYIRICNLNCIHLNLKYKIIVFTRQYFNYFFLVLKVNSVKFNLSNVLLIK